MKQLTSTQETLQTKEQALNQLEARYQELQAQLEELQTDATAKEETLQYLQNEKIVLEVALQAARADKSELDEGAERLGEEVLVASDTLDQLKQELQVKATQVRGLNMTDVLFFIKIFRISSDCIFFSFLSTRLKLSSKRMAPSKNKHRN